MKYLSIFLLFSFISFPIISQTSKLDSLKLELAKHQEDTNAIKLIETIIQSSSELDSVSFYAKRGMDLALNVDAYPLFLKVARTKLMKFYPRGEFEELIKHTELVLKEAILRKDTITIAKSNNNLGICYRRIGQMGQSISHLEYAAKIYESKQDSSLLSSTYSALANSYGAINDGEKAIHYHLLGLRLCEALNKKETYILICGNIGTLYFHQQNYEQALNYYREGLKIAIANDLNHQIGGMLNGIGSVFFSDKQLDSALVFYQKAILFNKKNEVWRSLGYSYNDIGVVHKNLGQYETALAYYQKALEIRKSSNEQVRVVETLLNIAKLYTTIGKPSIAFEYLKEAEQLSEQVEAWENKLRLYEIYSENFLAIKDYKASRNYLSKAYFLKDTMINEQQTRAISNLEIKYNLEKKQDSIQFLVVKNEITESNFQKQKLISSLTLILSLITIAIAGLLWHLFRLKKGQNRQLAHNNQNLLTLNEALTDELTEKESALLTPEILANKTLTLSSNGKEVIRLGDIIYFKAEGKAVQVFTKNKNHWDWVTLGSYEQILPKKLFLKIHRSYVVNILHIKNRKMRSLKMSNGIEINIGNTLRMRVKETLDQTDLN